MIKRDIFILIFSLVLIFSCEENPEISKEQEDFNLKVFGGSSTDVCNALITDGENLFLTGSINYTQGQDMFLIKTDKYGNEVSWSPVLFGNTSDEAGYDIAIDNNNNILVAGYAQSSSENTNVFVAKVNANGEELWKRQFGGVRDERAYALNTSIPNTILVAGYTESNDFAFKDRQGWLLALNENGDSLWSNDYGTSFVPDEIRDIIDMKDSLLLIGSTQSLFGNNKQDVFLFILKKTTKGIENSQFLFRPGNETGISAVYLPTSEIIVLGYTQVSTTVNNIVIWKLDENLRILKEHQITSNLSETPSSITFSNNTIIIVGTQTNEQGNDDYLVYTYNTDLTQISKHTFGSKGNQRGMTGVITGSSVIIGGSNTSGNSSKASIFKTPSILP